MTVATSTPCTSIDSDSRLDRRFWNNLGSKCVQVSCHDVLRPNWQEKNLPAPAALSIQGG